MTMKRLLAAGLGVFLALFLLTTFVPWSDAQARALAYGFTSEQVERGLQFSFERRLFFWLGSALELGLLVVLITTGMARRWADWFYARTRGSWLLTLVLMGLAYLVLHELLQFPVAVGRFYHSRAWGMTERDFGGWLAERLLMLGVMWVLEGGVGVGLYVMLLVWPRRWWLPATAGGAAVAVGIAWLWPVLISPLFNTFKPLSETEWADREPRVRALIDRAGIPVREILVMDASRQSNHSNAYFAGFGPSRRIVMFDTLLKKHTPEEVESVLAHEIGHWQYDHIVTGLLLGSLAAAVGLWVLSRILIACIGRPPLMLTRPADPAGLPLVLLLMNLGAWLAMPLENAVSRHFERQADRTALELAGLPEAFIEAEKRLARENIGNVAPTPWNVWLFSTHPTTIERIQMAEEWRRK